MIPRVLIVVVSILLSDSLNTANCQVWTPPVRRLSFLHVVRQPPNQRELQLTDTQVEEVSRIRNQAKDGYRAAMENATNFEGQDRSDFLRMAYQDTHKIADEKVKNMLTDQQLTRAKQLVLRARFESEGIVSLIHSEDVDDQLRLLRLPDEQKADLIEKNREAEEDLQKKLIQLKLEYQLAVKKLKVQSQADIFSFFDEGQRKIITRALGAEPPEPKTPLERFER